MTSLDLKRLREETGLTQSQFAKEVGVGVDTLRSWEIGRNKIRTLAEKVIIETHKRLTVVV